VEKVKNISINWSIWVLLLVSSGVINSFCYPFIALSSNIWNPSKKMSVRC